MTCLEIKSMAWMARRLNAETLMQQWNEALTSIFMVCLLNRMAAVSRKGALIHRRDFKY